MKIISKADPDNWTLALGFGNEPGKDLEDYPPDQERSIREVRDHFIESFLIIRTNDLPTDWMRRLLTVGMAFDRDWRRLRTVAAMADSLERNKMIQIAAPITQGAFDFINYLMEKP